MNLMQSTAREELPRRPPLAQCWRAALRPASLPKILLPIGVGVALALAGHAPHPVHQGEFEHRAPRTRSRGSCW